MRVGGDGASFNFADWGQDGSPLNPCGDPPGGVGAVLTPPTAEGGALRSQDLRTAGDPVSLDGAILRVDPATGAGPSRQSARDEHGCERAPDRRLRSPKPLPDQRAPGHERGLGRRRRLEHLGGDQPPGRSGRTPVENFGWPCYEGQGRQSRLRRRQPERLREPLRAGRVRSTGPYYTYNHSARSSRARRARPAAPRSSGHRLLRGRPLPGRLRRGALLRRLLARLHLGDEGGREAGSRRPASWRRSSRRLPTPSTSRSAPAGELFYADFDGGTIRRIQFASANQPPVAVATANPTSGAAPLTVELRRQRLERSRRGSDHLRVGSRRRRPLRRLDGSAADIHLYAERASPRGSGSPRLPTPARVVRLR